MSQECVHKFSAQLRLTFRSLKLSLKGSLKRSLKRSIKLTFRSLKFKILNHGPELWTSISQQILVTDLCLGF